jgi:glycosyltransferase involved in cell wall biosynthesis
VGVYVDVRALQNPIAAEGRIGRYVRELSGALERWFPEAVESYVIDAGRGAASPIDFLGHARVTAAEDIDDSAARAYHILSPFEFAPIARVWPRKARSLYLVVSVHDLIPFVFADRFLVDPAKRRWFGARLQLARCADHVVVPSEATKRDVVERANVDPQRITVTGEGVASVFQPPSDRGKAFDELRARRGIEPGFILCTGSDDPHKNLPRLLEAYAALPESVQDDHRLVLVGGIGQGESAITEQLEALGLTRSVELRGSVSDEELVLLYQTTELFVFPSLHEGYGLPVAEARACGAPVVASSISAIREVLVDDVGLFDPTDTASMTDAIEAGLTDRAFREQLLSVELDPRCSWRTAGARTVGAYAYATRTARKPTRLRRRVALVAPTAAERPSLDAYASRLAAQLAAHSNSDVELFADANARRFDLYERLRGGYDDVVYCVEDGTTAVTELERRPGVVLAPGVVLDGIDRVIELAEAFLVDSEYARRVAATHADPVDRKKISVLPRACPPRLERVPETRTIVGIFGGVGRQRQTEKAVEAFARAVRPSDDALLVFVGRRGARDFDFVFLRRAEELGISERVRIASQVGETRLRSWMARASAAVQLADSPEEPPECVPECLAGGLPTIVTAVGAALELPDDCVVKVDRDVSVDALAETLSDLLRNPERRAALRGCGLRYAEEHPFAALAAALHEQLRGRRWRAARPAQRRPGRVPAL